MDNSTPGMSGKLVDYLDGKLEPAEKQQIEKFLETDKDLRNELEGLEAAREAVKQYGLQQKVASVHQQMMNENKAPVRSIASTKRKIRYAIAVAASILLIVAGYFGYSFYSLSSEKVYTANYRSYDLTGVRDGNTEESAIETAYRAKKYTEVLTFNFDRPFTIKESFLRGMAFAETGDNSNAILSFKKVLEDNNTAHSNIFRHEAEFYLALTYVRNKDFDFALELFKNIKSNPEHLYKDRVTSKLIRQVRMLKWR